MKLNSTIKEHLDQSNNEALLAMLNKPSEFEPEALAYGESLLRQRGLSAAVEEIQAKHRQAEELNRQKTDYDLNRIDEAARRNLSNIFLHSLSVSSLRRHSSGIIISAFYNIAAGLYGVFNYSRLNWLLVILGIGCLVVGVRCARKPVPRRLLESGTTFILAAIWNLILGANGNQQNIIYWIGMLQAFWGTENISLFLRARKLPTVEPSSTDVALIDEVVAVVDKTSSTQSYSFMIGEWKAVVAYTSIVFMKGKGSDQRMLLARRDHISIRKKAKHFVGDKYAIILQVPQQKLKGYISGDKFRMLEKWLST